MMTMLWRLYFLIRRESLCRVGIHYRKPCPDASPTNFCVCCGTQLNPKAFSTYVVTLNDGTQIKVEAINEPHATNMVVYGESSVRGEVRVHPSNIASVVRVEDMA